ncbi:hypothetical protein HY988_04430 [Candidatus Micrarchaeota archaeon]|nr:hypothetical protein [Candidatus Micrarchaeota archaeon]
MEERKKTSKIEIYGAIIVGVLIILGIFFFIGSILPGAQDEFAKCLNEKGVKFYGAFWCPHCAEQKELFGNSAKYLNYIECSTNDLKQTQFCTDKNISTYPTWELKNGTRIAKVLPLENLSVLSGCRLNVK